MRMDLGHFELCLDVADIGASRHFYEQLGLSVVGGDEVSGWVTMECPSLRLNLYQGHIHANVMTFRGPEALHVAGTLAQREVPFDTPASVGTDGAVSAWIKDPDGNLIHLSSACSGQSNQVPG